MTNEQMMRDALEAMGYPEAQGWTAGDVGGFVAEAMQLHRSEIDHSTGERALAALRAEPTKEMTDGRVQELGRHRADVEGYV